MEGRPCRRRIAGGFRRPDARDGPVPGEHPRDRQAGRECLHVGALPQQPRHVVGERSRGSAVAAGAFFRHRPDTPSDGLEHGAGQVSAAGSDRDRLFDGGFPNAALRRGGPPPPGGLALMSFSVCDGGTPALRPVLRVVLSGRTATGMPGSVNRTSVTAPASPGRLALRAQPGDLGPRGLDLLAQRRAVRRRHGRLPFWIGRGISMVSRIHGVDAGISPKAADEEG